MPKIASITGVVQFTVNFSEEEAQVSEQRAATMARILKKLSLMDPALSQLVDDFVDYVSKKDEGAGC